MDNGFKSLISVLRCEDTSELKKVLTKLNIEWSQKYEFEEIGAETMNNIKQGLSQYIEKIDRNDQSIVVECLEFVRILSREKSADSAALNWPDRPLIKSLLQCAALVESQKIDFPTLSSRVINEAQKCLCNFVFQNSRARDICCEEGCVLSLQQRLSKLCSIFPDLQPPYNRDVLFYDLRLLFLITALCEPMRRQCRLGADDVRLSLVVLLHRLTNEETLSEKTSSSCLNTLKTDAVDLICESLKLLFNVMMGSKMTHSLEDDENDFVKDITYMLRELLLRDADNAEKTEELRNNVVNLLTAIPSPCYDYLAPCHIDGSEWDFSAIDALLTSLESRLDSPVKHQKETLSPILTLLTDMARASKPLRKYMKAKILPPLSDVTCKPEEGNTMRNKLVKLMTSVTDVNILSADFLFHLCHCNVGRLIKYTGFGNAAGMLARRGLMAGGPVKSNSESDSEDSDTEEYLKAKDTINPVLGCAEPEPLRPSPMEGMSEEQKEYEAMRLVDEINKMMEKGIVKPGRVGEDGKIYPIEHVLELQESSVKNPRRSSDNNNGEGQ